MAVELAVLSFVCAGLLAIFIPVERVYSSVSQLAIVLWLVAFNLIHGVNAILWAGNVDIHVPLWCDVATKVILGVKVALPGAFLGIARDLELLSSRRTISTNAVVIRNRKLLEIFLCYVFPILYMTLHLVVQDHRFDLVEDFGCFASIHPSSIAFTIISIPSLLTCSITCILCAVSIHNACRTCSSLFSEHLSQRGNPRSSVFFRRVAITLAMAAALGLIAIFSFFAVPNFRSWGSWSSVHADLDKIDIVTNSGEVKDAQFGWWSSFSITIVYLLLALGLGEETRDIYRYIEKQFEKERTLPRFTLPALLISQSSSDAGSTKSSVKKKVPRPLTLELKSGWDDMLDLKNSNRKASSRKLQSPTPSSHCPSPTPPSPSTKADEAFMASTISYLGSPPAKMLGLVSDVPQAFHAPVTPPRLAIDIPPRPVAPVPAPGQKITSPVRKLSTRKPVPKDAITAVLEAPWPVPPASPTPSLSPSRRSPTTSRTHSPASSAEESFGYPLYPTITPPHRHTRPFEGSSISSITEASQPSPISPAPKPLKPILKKSSIRQIHRSFSKERIGATAGPNDVIHMTVVQETV